MKRIAQFREIWLVLVNVALLALVGMRFPDFIRPGNLVQVFNDTSLLVMLALGQMAVIVSRSLDLSMASIVCALPLVLPLVYFMMKRLSR